MLEYLKRCAASVADQQSVRIEHIIVDNESDDETGAWLNNNPDVKKIIQKDDGMFDALNKGIMISKGDIIGHLNCDEQYLPGTLLKVEEMFKKNEDIDVIYGNTLLIDTQGNLLAFRKAMKPRYNLVVASHLYIFTCAIFFRRRIINEGIHFSTDFLTGSEMEFYLQLLKENYTFKGINEYLSVFTLRENNLSMGHIAKNERALMLEKRELFFRWMRYPINLVRMIIKIFSGAYYEKFPITYTIYTEDDLEKRKRFTYNRASPFWPSGYATKIH
jgi:glycosyltransferase involved in cell wall biosynthesis